MAIDALVWEHSTVSKTRDRLLEHWAVECFSAEIQRRADQRRLLPKSRFTVDGTPIHAWASRKSFRANEGSDDQRRNGGGRNAQARRETNPRSSGTHARSVAVKPRAGAALPPASAWFEQARPFHFLRLDRLQVPFEFPVGDWSCLAPDLAVGRLYIDMKPMPLFAKKVTTKQGVEVFGANFAFND